MMHGKLLVLGRGGGGGGGKIGRNVRAEGGTKGELKENDTGVTKRYAHKNLDRNKLDILILKQRGGGKGEGGGTEKTCRIQI